MVDIVNILATGDLNREIDLEQAVQDIECSNYNPNTFPGLILRSSFPGTVLLFKSGKYSITGCKNEKEIEITETEFIETLEQLGIRLDNNELATIRNIVCTGNLDIELNLSSICIELGLESVEYEPEQSPFLIYRPPLRDCVITISASGKVVITGVISKNVAEDAFEDLRKELY